MEKWLGIDFSGNWRKWGPGCTHSNVWIAELTSDDNRFLLTDLRSVQELKGSGRPFSRLISKLASDNFEAAGIDAPFSIPARFIPNQQHSALLKLVQSIDSSVQDFPTGRALLNAVTRSYGNTIPAKPLRNTEERWRHKVNVRSSLWNGRARPGAPFTAACLKLLAECRRPMWPFSPQILPGTIVEAFPAAQLCHWKLPCRGYNGDSLDAKNLRSEIIEGLATRMINVCSYTQLLEENADALDAVISASAAIAVTRHKVEEEDNAARIQDTDAAIEGWIAIHQ